MKQKSITGLQAMLEHDRNELKLIDLQISFAVTAESLDDLNREKAHRQELIRSTEEALQERLEAKAAGQASVWVRQYQVDSRGCIGHSGREGVCGAPDCFVITGSPAQLEKKADTYLLASIRAKAACWSMFYARIARQLSEAAFLLRVKRGMPAARFSAKAKELQHLHSLRQSCGRSSVLMHLGDSHGITCCGTLSEIKEEPGTQLGGPRFQLLAEHIGHVWFSLRAVTEVREIASNGRPAIYLAK